MTDDVQGNRSNAEVVISLEGMIKNHLRSLETLKEEISKQEGMLKDSLANDPEYAEAEIKAKEAGKEKTRIKAALLKRPQLMELNAKVKELKSERKSSQLSLFDYAAEYSKLSGSDEIETDDGQLMLIVMQGKLVKKSSFN